MNTLLDTNVISEMLRPRPNRGLVDFVMSLEAHEISLSVVTVFELRYGAQRLPQGQRRDGLIMGIEHILKQYEHAILPVDTRVSRLAATARVQREQLGRPSVLSDLLIAATCCSHSLVLATRNVKDFEGVEGLKVINPFSS